MKKASETSLLVFVLVIVIGILVLSGQLFAVPYLEIVNTSTTPSTLYPGTEGYLFVTVSNTGDTTTDSAVVTYSSVGADTSVQLGRIAAGSNKQVAIPIIISSKTTNGIQLVDLAIYYTYADSSSGSSKKTGENKISVPLIVRQYDPLVVDNIKFESSAVSVGEKVPVSFDLHNTGGVVNNVRVSIPENSSFYFDAQSQVDVGSIPVNSSSHVSLILVTSSDTPTGTYGIPFTISYHDQLNEEAEKTVSIGPISVVESSTQCRLTLVPEDTVEIGSEVAFDLSIDNSGSSPISAVVNINSTSTFIPVGMQSIYFDSIPAHSKVSKKVSIGISSSASAGYYVLPIQMTTIPGSSATYNIGIAVTATPDVKVALLNEGGTKQIQVTNIGNSQIRSVNLAITSSGSPTSTESFIGTLNVDDYSTVSLPNSAASEVTVVIAFRDSNNQLHTIAKTLSASGEVTDATTGVSAGSGASSPASSGNSLGNRTGTRPSMGLFGPGSSSGKNGIDLTLLGGIVLVCIVGGYFFYHRFFAKPKNTLQKQHEQMKPQEMPRKPELSR